MGPLLLLLLVTTGFWLWERTQRKERERTIRSCRHCTGRMVSRTSGTSFDPETTRYLDHERGCPNRIAIK